MIAELVPSAPCGRLCRNGALARENGRKDPSCWDTGFVRAPARSAHDYTDDQLRPYFPLPGARRMLWPVGPGTDRARRRQHSPPWHADVQYFHVLRNGQPIACFKIPTRARPKTGRCLDERLPAAAGQARTQLPVVHLVCNGTPPVGDTPSLMSFSESRHFSRIWPRPGAC